MFDSASDSMHTPGRPEPVKIRYLRDLSAAERVAGKVVRVISVANSKSLLLIERMVDPAGPAEPIKGLASDGFWYCPS